jgi:hypothetical protein
LVEQVVFLVWEMEPLAKQVAFLVKVGSFAQLGYSAKVVKFV